MESQKERRKDRGNIKRDGGRESSQSDKSYQATDLGITVDLSRIKIKQNKKKGKGENRKKTKEGKKKGKLLKTKESLKISQRKKQTLPSKEQLTLDFAEEMEI